MKILFVSHRYPPSHTAGTETYAYNLASRLKTRHRILVFHADKRLTRPDHTLIEERHDGVEVRILVNNLLHRDFGETFENPRAEAAFARILDTFRPDVVHVHHLMFLSLGLPSLARARGIPVVMTLHDFFLACPRGGRFMLPDGTRCPGPDPERCLGCVAAMKYRQRGWEQQVIRMLARVRKFSGLNLTKLVYGLRDRVFKRDLGAGVVGPARGDPPVDLAPHLEARRRAVMRVFEDVDRFMTPSDTVGKGLVAAGLPPEKLMRWSYGIDLRPFRGLVEARNRRDGEGGTIGDGMIRDGATGPDTKGAVESGGNPPVAAYLGTLMPHKGVHVLVEAASGIDPCRLRCRIRGSSTQNPAYAKELRDRAGPGTVFEPPFGRDEVGRAFEAVDLLVLPSLWVENSPVVIQEAFAAGCPVIASDLGGMRELVRDDVDGRLFPAGDAAALAEILGQVARDPGLLEGWRRNIEPPRNIEDDVESLENLYTTLSIR